MSIKPELVGQSHAFIYEGKVVVLEDSTGTWLGHCEGVQIPVTPELWAAAVADREYQAKKHDEFDSWKLRERWFREHPLFK